MKLDEYKVIKCPRTESGYQAWDMVRKNSYGEWKFARAIFDEEEARLTAIHCAALEIFAALESAQVVIAHGIQDGKLENCDDVLAQIDAAIAKARGGAP